MRWVMDTYRWIIETVLRSDTSQGFEVLPRRWVVERTADPARTTSGRQAAVPSALLAGSIGVGV